MIKIKNLNTIAFIVAVTIFNIFAYNYALYEFAFKNIDSSSFSGVLILFSLSVALFGVSAFIFFILSSVLPLIVLKLFFVLIFVCNSIALYFVNTYNVILDKSMMGNVFNTNSLEAFSYFDINLVLYLFFLGVIPSLVVFKLEVIKIARWLQALVGVLILCVSIAILYLNSPTWLWFDKNAKVIGGLTMPWSYSINALRYKLKELKKNKKREKLPNASFLNNEKKLVVLVIGESARSANFSLYGYKKETNPKLKEQNIEVLKNSSSTTTYTTASIHSMLAHDSSTSSSYELLPNYLQRNGVDVFWRANNWGVPPLKISSFKKADILREECEGACNYDEVLLTNLKSEINSNKKNKLFMVLHTAGSHGPKYYKKYPKNFEYFAPICKSVDLSKCSKEELINAYNNTILYTDYFLDKTIEILKEIKDRKVLFIYISDHGESLGEYGLYLHGTPNSLAPAFQRDIPFLIWKSEDFNKEIKKQDSYSQKNIFHTIMGAFDMRSSIYKEELDLLKN